VTGPPPASPLATPVFRPMLAIPVFEEIQFTELVRFCVLLSVYVPVAVNAWVRPLATDGPPGVTAIETNAGGPTVRSVDPRKGPFTAVICTVPS